MTGANGAGKSTLLKRIKEMRVDALLLGAETGFLDADNGLSTGQRRVKEIESALSMAPTLLLLDEWNANLDGENCRKIDQLMDEASRRMVVIEVRHLRPGEPPSAGRSSFDGLRTNGG
ncbi:phosphate transporter ATP-binding protein [compost metagenome]